MATGVFWALCLAGAIGLLVSTDSLLSYLLAGAIGAGAVFSSCVLQMKRFHDRNRSGWRMLVFVFLLLTDPLLAISEHLVEMFIIGGTRGPNSYGSMRNSTDAAISTV